MVRGVIERTLDHADVRQIRIASVYPGHALAQRAEQLAAGSVEKLDPDPACPPRASGDPASGVLDGLWVPALRPGGRALGSFSTERLTTQPHNAAKRLREAVQTQTVERGKAVKPFVGVQPSGLARHDGCGTWLRYPDGCWLRYPDGCIHLRHERSHVYECVAD